MRYANWAARDGGYDNRKIIPNFTVLLVKASSEEQAEGEIESHFGELARRHREFLFDHYDEETGTTVYRREPPLIFGFAIIGHIAILITLDAADVTATTMALAELNLAEPNQGIWNGLTIAIVICQARDQMMKMMGDFPEKSREPESDVDA